MAGFRWAVFGTGMVAAKFVAGLAAARDAQAVLVASRSLDTAQGFAGALRIPRAVAGYAEAAGAGGYDAAYIATPPAQHRDHALACIAAGVPVLIEKPFASSAGHAAEIAAAARAAGVFAMEGMWTRFLPAAQALKAQVEGGAIGDVRSVGGALGFSKQPDVTDGDFDPARGGGALAHLGVYPLSLAQWLFGTPVTVAAHGRLGETGVDEDAALLLDYPGGVNGHFAASLRAPMSDFTVFGTGGSLALAGPVFRPHGVAALRVTARRRAAAGFGRKAALRESGPVQRFAQLGDRLGLRGPRITAHPFAGNGYHYEADEVARCVRAGLTESAVMPLADSLAVADTLDRARAMIHGGSR